MKILIISDVATHPVTAGNRSWTLSQVRLLRGLGHEVHFLWIKNDFSGKSDYTQTKKYWGDKFHFFNKSVLYKWRTLIINKYRRRLCNGYWKCDDHYPPFLKQKVKRLVSEFGFDVCMVNYYYLTKLFSGLDVPLKALFTHDCFSYKYLATQIKRVESLQANEEAKAMQRSPHIFALQDTEAAFFGKLSPQSRVYSVYGQFDYVDTPIMGNRKLLFLSGGNRFNIEGIMWFVNEILPLIVSRYPDVELIIGGSICTELSSLKEHPSIRLVGFVDDVASFYSLADIAINPVCKGTGLKIKTFEALSYGKVTIVHPHSMDGVFKKEHSPLLVAASPADWLKSVSQVMENREAVAINKASCGVYFEEMNRFIVSEYQSFFNSLS